MSISTSTLEKFAEVFTPENFAPPSTSQTNYHGEKSDFFRSNRCLNGSHSTFKGKRCFSMSFLEVVESQALKDQILKLGGTVCEDSTIFNPLCTHLISSQPLFSEKITCVIASGRWLLCPSYIKDSVKAGHFLNEEDYQWGNPKAESKLPTTNNPRANNIAMAYYKLRQQLRLRSIKEHRSVGIFSNFRVILHLDILKDGYKRVIEAGCGVVVELNEQENFQGATHCIVDERIDPMSYNTRVALYNAGVHCVKKGYIQACLLNDSLPNVKDFLA